MKPRAVVLSILVVGALSACNAPKQAQQEATPRPVLVAAVHYEPRERAAGAAGDRQGAHRERSGLPRRRQDRPRGSSTPAPSSRKGEPLATLDESDLKACSSSRPRPSKPRRVPRSLKPRPRKSASTALARQGWAANADFDKVKSTADQARGAVDKAERAVSLARNALELRDA